MVLAFYIECACPPERRSATVGAGNLESVDDFLDSYPLTHIVCQACDRYYRLIGYIDDDGIERRVQSAGLPSSRRGKKLASLLRSAL